VVSWFWLGLGLLTSIWCSTSLFFLGSFNSFPLLSVMEVTFSFGFWNGWDGNLCSIWAWRLLTMVSVAVCLSWTYLRVISMFWNLMSTSFFWSSIFFMTYSKRKFVLSWADGWHDGWSKPGGVVPKSIHKVRVVSSSFIISIEIWVILPLALVRKHSIHITPLKCRARMSSMPL